MVEYYTAYEGCVCGGRGSQQQVCHSHLRQKAKANSWKLQRAFQEGFSGLKTKPTVQTAVQKHKETTSMELRLPPLCLE